MPYFKVIHEKDLDFDDNDKTVKVICQKLYDHPIRTYLYIKAKHQRKIRAQLGHNDKMSIIPVRFLLPEIKGVS